jgi:hypothetical protein
MTGSPIRLPCAGKPALKTTTPHRPNKPESSTSLVDLPALNSMRPTAPASRPHGRCAVGLHPSLDPAAYFSAPKPGRGRPHNSENNQETVLTGPAPSGMTCRINLSASRAKSPHPYQCDNVVTIFNPEVKRRKSNAAWELPDVSQYAFLDRAGFASKAPE